MNHERLYSTPATAVSQNERISSRAENSPSVVAIPMAVSRAPEVPPPLPPSNAPSFLAGLAKDPGWQWGQNDGDFGQPAIGRTGFSALGGGGDGTEAHRHGRSSTRHLSVVDRSRQSSHSTIIQEHELDMAEDVHAHVDHDKHTSAGYVAIRLH